MKRSHVINGAVILLAVVAGAAASLRPWRVYREQKADAEKQIQDMRASEKRRADLLRQEGQARSYEGHEEHARALGYVRPGQVPADTP